MCHFFSLYHDFNWKDTEILDKESTYMRHLISEMIYIKCQRNGINKQDETELSDSYLPILNYWCRCFLLYTFSPLIVFELLPTFQTLCINVLTVDLIICIILSFFWDWFLSQVITSLYEISVNSYSLLRILYIIRGLILTQIYNRTV